MCMSSVSNVIYHKFSHGAAFYTLNGKNVNVMLELGLMLTQHHWAGVFLDRVATVREKYLENEIFSRSWKSQGILWMVREI